MISIVVPAYNEEERVVPFLRDLENFVKGGNYEVVLVNDGSNDKTLDILKSFSKKSRAFRVVSYKNNMGKGYAVKQGVLSARGEYIIFIDADGSIHPKEIRKMEPLLKKYDVVVGTRSSKDSVVVQPKKRKSLGMAFNTSASVIFQTGIADSLCGFKGFRREIGKKLFREIVSSGWIFDVELFYRIRKGKYSLYQLPIYWEHREGSKIKPFDIPKMFFQMLVLRVRLTGR